MPLHLRLTWWHWGPRICHAPSLESHLVALGTKSLPCPFTWDSLSGTGDQESAMPLHLRLTWWHWGPRVCNAPSLETHLVALGTQSLPCPFTWDSLGGTGDQESAMPFHLGLTWWHWGPRVCHAPSLESHLVALGTKSLQCPFT